jgi:hypothetical protein
VTSQHVGHKFGAAVVKPVSTLVTRIAGRECEREAEEQGSWSVTKGMAEIAV